ncbi:cysteine hydrolase family protein [Amycolatopsis sp. YIM 10]|uniref:cysteine hydrolase family protein n=1 Tax=Amycolatopsis sp. YIM 10 TaxID=2653857 RepID=UPI00128FE0D6|nr:isochorismatase family cysteine hydrolase [Amycolatopsis sp. YIM 10]QFU89148.1 Peroxyureidoacrylate/ureidoacrylate amidohydrolase RutB [Amycolatopsis sp. YIM 10]
MSDALIVVDVQNLFVDMVGARGPAVVAEVNRHVAEAVERGAPVFYTRDYAPIDLPDGDPEGHTSLHPDLDVRGTVVEKGPGKRGGFSGFLLAPVLEPQQGHGGGGLGPLAGLLADTGARSVTVVGIATDICVAATARDAVRLGYRVTIPLDATAYANPVTGGEHPVLGELRAAGVTLLAGAQPVKFTSLQK